MNRLTIIIPSKNAENLNVCIPALRKCEPKARIIVIDDGINRTHLSDSVRHKCEFIEGEKPFIFARNCNIGIATAVDSDIVLLNDDAILKTIGGLSLLQKEAENNPKYGFIGATTNVTVQILQKPLKIGLRSLPHIAFVCVLIPRRTIEKIGLLDERYCIDYGVEDRDYCEMVSRAGMLVGVHDGCYVDHGSLTSSFRGQPMRPGRSDCNRALFVEKFKMRTYWVK